MIASILCVRVGFGVEDAEVIGDIECGGGFENGAFGDPEEAASFLCACFGVALGEVEGCACACSTELIGEEGIAWWEFGDDASAELDEFHGLAIGECFRVQHRGSFFGLGLGSHPGGTQPQPKERATTMQYENTLIYAQTRALLHLTHQVLTDLPTGYGFLADQLRRASSSILLNFAEGYGKSSSKDARRFFIIARGSTNEVAAILDVAQDFGVVEAQTVREGKEQCDHIARMLTRFRA